MAEGYGIRLARLEDAAAITGLCGQLGYPTQPPAVQTRLAEILAAPAQVVYVAEAPLQGVMGWVHVLRVCYLEAEPFAEIGGLVVERGQRGLGIGRALMAAGEAWARHQGLATVRLRSNIVRKEAHIFYQRIGYTIEKTQLTFGKPLIPGEGESERRAG